MREINLFNKLIVFILIGLSLVLISNFLGHFAAPFSILVTPLLLPFVIGGVNAVLYRENYYLTVLYGVGLLFLNDILIRLYAGGIHDDAGKGWITLCSCIAFSIAGLAMAIFAIITSSNVSIRKRVYTITLKVLYLLFMGIMATLLYDQFLSKV